VGRTYPAEFYSWVQNVNTRRRFEKLANETEEDYQNLIKLLTNKFGVRVLRPEFPEDLTLLYINGKWVQPPTAPRDYFLMIQEKFWVPEIPNASHAWSVFYRQNKQAQWPDFVKPADFYAALPEHANQIKEKFDAFKVTDQAHLDGKLGFYNQVFEDIKSQGNEIVKTDLDFINGCFVSRIGQDLYFATQTYHDDQQKIINQVNQLFPNTRNRVVNSGGHGDAVFCPVAPGLIISLNDVPTYADTFPEWEVVYLPPSNYAHMREFEYSMKRIKGRWFMPGFEQDHNLITMVDHYFDEWVGQVSETVFDVNILVVNPKNIVVSSHNDQVEAACARHGIEVHVVPFRHKYFWDCGIHCVTNDLSRVGDIKDYSIL
jgi:N-dimethylarginine dimethylaminohydrolase